MIKMNELIKRSDTPKSTILYYIKEGLLPQPHKDKPNLHLYDESCVEIIEFIKYLQTNFNSTIAEIKALFSHPNFDIKSPYDTLLTAIDAIMGANLTKTYTKSELEKEFNLSKNELDKYVKDGFLMPRDGAFTSKEREILAIIKNSNKEQLNLIKEYILVAKNLSLKEIGLSTDRDLKQLFDILLILKPYILNLHTLNSYKRKTV